MAFHVYNVGDGVVCLFCVDVSIIDRRGRYETTPETRGSV